MRAQHEGSASHAQFVRGPIAWRQSLYPAVHILKEPSDETTLQTANNFIAGIRGGAMSDIKSIGPQIGAGYHIDQLHIYVGSFRAAPHTPADYVTYIKLNAQLSHIYRTRAG